MIKPRRTVARIDGSNFSFRRDAGCRFQAHGVIGRISCGMAKIPFVPTFPSFPTGR